MLSESVPLDEFEYDDPEFEEYGYESKVYSPLALSVFSNHLIQIDIDAETIVQRQEQRQSQSSSQNSSCSVSKLSENDDTFKEPPLLQSH